MQVVNFIRERREAPVVYTCGRDVDLEPGIRYGPVIRDVYIIECCTGGYGSAIINGREFPVGPGNCYILLPGDTVIHTADANEPRTGVWCAVDGLQIGRALASVGITSQMPYAPAEAFAEITEQVERIVQMAGDTDPGAELRRTACVYALLGALVRNSTVTDQGQWVQKAVGLMEARYYEPITVEWLAGQVGLERSYFSVLFREKTGLPPHAYLTSLRIKKACVLMKELHYSVTSAAEAVGLDPRNFARLFKRETGKTPAQYKRG